MATQMTLWIHIGIGALLVLMFFYLVVLQMRINGLRRKLNFFMAGENGVSLERKLAVEVKELRDAATAMESLFSKQEQMAAIQGHTFQKIGFVKYNAFENIGNDLSFALTLLDGNLNGICISSVYGRNESRIFCKPIVKGKSLVALSQEELESVTEALGNTPNEAALASASVMK